MVFHLPSRVSIFGDGKENEKYSPTSVFNIGNGVYVDLS